LARVKICGLASFEDALMAAQAGADALGVIMEPSSPRFAGWTESDFNLLKEKLGPFRPPVVAVYGRRGPRLSADLVQFVEGSSDPHEPSILTVRPEPSLDWRAFEERVAAEVPQALLVDAYMKDSFGGTGHRVDDHFIEEVMSRFSLPIVLAGGLNPENVGGVVRRFRPYGVDVATGVESASRMKDQDLVAKFIQESHSQ
jgi:phosphoribosylanthranilate isomerase